MNCVSMQESSMNDEKYVDWYLWHAPICTVRAATGSRASVPTPYKPANGVVVHIDLAEAAHHLHLVLCTVFVLFA